jgi:hypothetical protein
MRPCITARPEPNAPNAHPAASLTRPLRDNDAIDPLSGRHEIIQSFVTPGLYSEARIRLVTSCRRRPNLPLVYSLKCAVGSLRPNPRSGCCCAYCNAAAHS